MPQNVKEKSIKSRTCNKEANLDFTRFESNQLIKYLLNGEGFLSLEEKSLKKIN